MINSIDEVLTSRSQECQVTLVLRSIRIRREIHWQIEIDRRLPLSSHKRRQHGCPARPLATNHRDFPYLNKFFDLCLPRQRRQKCLLTPTNVTTGNQRWRPQTSLGWQVFHEPRINPQAHEVPP